MTNANFSLPARFLGFGYLGQASLMTELFLAVCCTEGLSSLRFFPDRTIFLSRHPHTWDPGRIPLRYAMHF